MRKRWMMAIWMGLLGLVCSEAGAQVEQIVPSEEPPIVIDAATVLETTSCEGCGMVASELQNGVYLPGWTFQAEAMWLKRNDISGVPLAELRDQESFELLASLSGGDIDLKLEPGMRLMLSAPVGSTTLCEISYFGLHTSSGQGALLIDSEDATLQRIDSPYLGYAIVTGAQNYEFVSQRPQRRGQSPQGASGRSRSWCRLGHDWNPIPGDVRDLPCQQRHVQHRR